MKINNINKFMNNVTLLFYKHTQNEDTNDVHKNSYISVYFLYKLLIYLFLLFLSIDKKK